ncbi:MAG: type II secretion system F family protein [Candidatus Omnitrophica bacterium]|nr:type II secretion system F family protein [Candidatus Omnitrophota bacterium]
MPIYLYKAKIKPEVFRTGTIEAENERAAAAKLLLLNYHPLSIKVKNEESLVKFGFLNKIKPKNLYIFLRQFSNLISAGLPLVKALSNIVEQTENQNLKGIIVDLKEKIQRGKTLSEALSYYKNIFSALEINMIKSAEATGMLAEVLTKIADLKEKDINFSYRIRTALAYPVLLVSVGFITLFVLTTFVLPKFVALFNDLDQQLPLITKALIWVSLFFKNYWIFILIILAGFSFSFGNYLRTKRGRKWFDQMKLKVFFLKSMIIKIQTARFASNLGTLVQSGISIINALQIVSEMATNMVFSEEITLLYSKVAKGQHLSESMKNSSIFEKNTLDLISIGEESGRLEEMLFRIAYMNEVESSQQIETIMFMIEPILILSLGFIIALIVLAILLPIFQMNFLMQ